MNYQTYNPSTDLEAFVKCYWTLEVPAEISADRQRIIPDGCIEMAFLLGDDVRRYTTDTEYINQPRAMIIGQITEPFYIQPVGYVNTFSVRFFPYGFANFTTTTLKDLANTETPISGIFGEELAQRLTDEIESASDTLQRISIVERFLSGQLFEKPAIDSIVSTTVDMLIQTKGGVSVNDILQDELSKRRQLERNFSRQIGISPKQLGRIIRVQTALSLLLNRNAESLTSIAYESDYFDQAHFIRDFKEFTGLTPKDFLDDQHVMLSTLFYK